MNVYYEVKISAENQKQVDAILDSLLEKKLATGGQFITAPARFLWKGEVENTAEYVTITSYTTDQHKAAIIKDVRRTAVEDFPMITFVAIDDLNDELKQWISETIK
jgi:uncharacterized protein involved in tolerance to divalent cations